MNCKNSTNQSDKQCNISDTDSPLTDPKDKRDFLQEKPFLKWTCNICLRKFRTEKILNDHKQSIHEGKCFPCTFCSKTFGSDNSLKAHLKRHTKQPTKMCKLCCKIFFHQSELNQHILSHKKEKTFKCDSCNKTYTHKYELNRHLKACWSKVVCNQCNNVFSGKKNLQEHIRTKHAEKPVYKCELCPDEPEFKYRSTLWTHKKWKH